MEKMKSQYLSFFEGRALCRQQGDCISIKQRSLQTGLLVSGRLQSKNRTVPVNFQPDYTRLPLLLADILGKNAAKIKGI